MELEPSSVPWQVFYKFMIGSIVPRPIGWVSTVSEEGVPNLAPFSFFNAVCANPPVILFCPMTRSTDRRSKDTVNNIRTNGEFVVNIVSEELAEAMNATSAELPPEVDEFAVANLITAPSVTVNPPRVALSPVQFECKLSQILEISEQPGGGSVVLGQVTYLHVRDEVLFDGDKIDIHKLKPVGRLAGSAYCRINDIFHMVRPPSRLSPS